LAKHRLYILAATVVFASGYTAWDWVYDDDSIQAFVNARVIDVRSPISGTWMPEPDAVRAGAYILGGEAFGKVKGADNNPLALSLRLQRADLERQTAVHLESIASLKGRLQSRESELSRFQYLLARQIELRAKNWSIALDEAEAELAEGIARSELRKSQSRRIRALAGKGFVSEDELEAAEMSHHEAAARVEALRSRQEQILLDSEADELGLQLGGMMTFSYPQLRVEEIELEIKDLKLDLKVRQAQLDALRKQVNQVSLEQEREERRIVSTGFPVLIWSVETQGVAQVSMNQTLLRVIDCSNMWVEAFVNERAASTYRQGSLVRVSPIGSPEHWNGKVEFVRYGTGRVSIGQPVTEPPPEISRRQLPVRVATVKIRVDWPDENNGIGSCPVGLSVKVSPAQSLL